MLVKEGALLALPGAPLTVDLIDDRRKKARGNNTTPDHHN